MNIARVKMRSTDGCTSSVDRSVCVCERGFFRLKLHTWSIIVHRINFQWHFDYGLTNADRYYTMCQLYTWISLSLSLCVYVLRLFIRLISFTHPFPVCICHVFDWTIRQTQPTNANKTREITGVEYNPSSWWKAMCGLVAKARPRLWCVYLIWECPHKIICYATNIANGMVINGYAVNVWNDMYSLDHNLELLSKNHHYTISIALIHVCVKWLMHIYVSLMSLRKRQD